MTTLPLSLIGLATSLLAIHVYLKKNGIVIPRKIPFDIWIILTHSAMITCTVFPFILWAFAAWMFIQASWQIFHGLPIPFPALSLLGACWSPTLFCFGILFTFFITDFLQRRFGKE